MAASLGDQSTLVSVQNSLGRAYLLTGKYAQAQRCLLEARVLAERHHMERSVALADEFLGDLMLAQGRFAEARQNYESGLKLARGFAPRGDVVGEILRRLADLELAVGLRSQAIATGKRALKVCEGCNELHEIGFIHRTLGLALQGLGKTREAVVELTASVAAFERTRNPFELAWSRTHLAALHWQQGDREGWLRAVREAEAALQLFRSLEEDRGACTAGLILARAHRSLGSNDDGLLALYDLERVCEENPTLEHAAEIQMLRRELEHALMTRSADPEAGPVQLFSELYSLAHAGEDFDARLHEVLGSLCARTQCSGALIAFCTPAAGEPQVQIRHGMQPGEAARLARFLARDGIVAARLIGHGDAELAHAVPEIARRAVAVLCQPLCLGDRKLGFLGLERHRDAGGFTQEDVDFIATYANLAAVMIHENRREWFDLPEAPATREHLDPVLNRILTQDPAMFEVLALAQKVARSGCTVLLAGETGTGKGLLAHCIHAMSERRSRKFIAVNCAALPEQLLESELFGHVRGAFTGAETEKLGLFEAAHGGTVFLDEVGKTSLFMQGKLLQFLDSSEVRPVGSNEFRHVDVRVLCASKTNLRDLVAEGKLLEDLYYRLNDFPLTLPPLRERPGDIRLLAEHALHRAAADLRKRVPVLSRVASLALDGYAWPGNVRELEKCIKRAVILADDGQPILLKHLPEELQAVATRAEDSKCEPTASLRECVAQTEARVIRAALQRSGGNKSEAARLLGVSYPCLLQKIRAYALSLD
jgi:transcriptional regulator with GAF, ATPase, and Fis domain